MEMFWLVGGGLIYGLSLLLAYKQGIRDARGDETPVVALQVPQRKPKAKPTTEDEKKAAERQRRIDEFRG